MDNLLEFLRDIQSDEIFKSLDEAAIKQAIVLKILSLLEWDPFNIDEIQPEYGLEDGKVDFLLKHKDSHKVFLGVKKELNGFEKYQEKFLSWAVQGDVKIAVLTDGFTWRFFLPLIEGNLENKKFHTIEIHREKAEDVKQSFSDVLSKQNIISDNTVKIAKDIFNNRKKIRLINEYLPKAWLKIMNEPEKWLVDIISEVTEDLCGYKPEGEAVQEFIISEVKTEAEKSGLHRSKPSEEIKKNGQKDYKGKTLKSFTFMGEAYSVKSWKQMLLKICHMMFEKNKDSFESLLFITLKGRDCFSKDPHEFVNCEEISGTHIYVDLNLSAMSVVVLCKEILIHFGHKESDFFIETK